VVILYIRGSEHEGWELSLAGFALDHGSNVSSRVIEFIFNCQEIHGVRDDLRVVRDVHGYEIDGV
jgi:hypothetical protein